MNLAGVMRGLARRWYIAVPGLLVVAALALGMWTRVAPGHERTATQLLLPGAASVPDNANPYLYLSGLSVAADVVVRAVGSDNVQNEVNEKYPKTEVVVARDSSTAGPVIVITVTAASDEKAAAALGYLVDKTRSVLAQLQDAEKIADAERISVAPISVDTRSVLQQRNRLVATALAGAAGVVVVLLATALVDGLITQRARRAAGARAADEPPVAAPPPVRRPLGRKPKRRSAAQLPAPGASPPGTAVEAPGPLGG